MLLEILSRVVRVFLFHVLCDFLLLHLFHVLHATIQQLFAFQIEIVEVSGAPMLLHVLHPTKMIKYRPGLNR